MTIEYEKGAMLVTHGTGIVDIYVIAELEDMKTRELKELASCQSSIDGLDVYIANAKASVGKKEPID